MALRVMHSSTRLHFAVAGVPLQVPDAFLEPAAAGEAPLPIQVTAKVVQGKHARAHALAQPHAQALKS